jgi:hypothetical protein
MTEQTTAPVEDKAPVPGTPEYDAAMLAVKAEARGEQTEAAQRPDNIPEKFWDAEKGQLNTEALLNSYKELESGVGKAADEAPAMSAEGDAQAQALAQEAGLDWNTIVSKVSESGDIEEADYAALEAIKIPRELVKDVIELRKYRVDREREAAIEYAGGVEATEALMQWAGANLNATDREAYQALLNGPQWRVGIDALKTLQAGSSKASREPRLQGGGMPVPSAGAGYSSREEMLADQSNPLYHDRGPKGAAFRAQVAQRVAVSSWKTK